MVVTTLGSNIVYIGLRKHAGPYSQKLWLSYKEQHWLPYLLLFRVFLIVAYYHTNIPFHLRVCQFFTIHVIICFWIVFHLAFINIERHSPSGVEAQLHIRFKHSRRSALSLSLVIVCPFLLTPCLV